jgi:hypothetical protein
VALPLHHIRAPSLPYRIGLTLGAGGCDDTFFTFCPVDPACWHTLLAFPLLSERFRATQHRASLRGPRPQDLVPANHADAHLFLRLLPDPKDFLFREDIANDLGRRHFLGEHCKPLTELPAFVAGTIAETLVIWHNEIKQYKARLVLDPMLNLLFGLLARAILRRHRR